MLDTPARPQTIASLLERSLGQIVDGIADGDISARDGSLAAVT
jgi:hypothetical protein